MVIRDNKQLIKKPMSNNKLRDKPFPRSCSALYMFIGHVSSSKHSNKVTREAGDKQETCCTQPKKRQAVVHHQEVCFTTSLALHQDTHQPINQSIKSTWRTFRNAKFSGIMCMLYYNPSLVVRDLTRTGRLLAGQCVYDTDMRTVGQTVWNIFYNWAKHG